ncbi:uncharacterized protein LOC110424056 isoform X1 [Herrania umbratica]|uniref:Uncharacterized protein LOC110424056 isoform X1 n=1 Tax=Herrania umbratica TaxID=108875 RepID=A0A6J1B4J3_9ROSI|nr:uncharacterized protein LOC110424056 isoform X1 [Herrania umbratica]
MNSSGGTHSPATFRRKTRRRRRCGTGAPSTPLLHWTFYSNNDEKKKHPHHQQHHSSACARAGGRHVELSARKLAAGLWQLRLSAELSCCRNTGFACKRRSSDRFRPGKRGSDTKHDQLRRSQSTILGPKQGTLYNLESVFPHSKSVTEGATKWDSRCLKTPIEAYCFVSHMKLLEDQVKTVSFVSALQAKLVRAQLYIHDLESEVRSSRKKVKYLLRKLGEERMSQNQKVHDNIYAFIDDLKGQLSRERKNQQRMEILNSQLVKELAEAKLSATKFIQKYEEEKRTSALMQEVCNQLATKIGEDKAEVEDLRIEIVKIREVVEEERKMLQMAEVWREERVQMKLSDAKLALESKYSQMNKLITVLETFLRSRSASLDVTELSTAEVIGQAVISVSNIQDIEEFSYDPLRSGDIFSNFEGLQQVEVSERETEPCFNFCSTGDVSNYHPVSPEKYDHGDYGVPKLSSAFVDYNSGMEEDSRGQERVNHAENQGSSYSFEEIMNTVDGCKNAPRCEIEWDEATGGNTPNTEISEICSIPAERSKRKKSSAKLRTSCASSSGYKAISDEGDGRLSSGTVSSLGTIFPNRKSVKGGLRHQNSMGQWGSRDLVNPHIARGMKGSIEWPRVFQKNTLKAKHWKPGLKERKFSCTDTAPVDS